MQYHRVPNDPRLAGTVLTPKDNNSLRTEKGQADRPLEPPSSQVKDKLEVRLIFSKRKVYWNFFVGPLPVLS